MLERSSQIMVIYNKRWERQTGQPTKRESFWTWYTQYMFMHGFSLNENVGQYPCFVTVPIRVLTQTSQLLNIQLFLMFEFLGTHGHLLHTWHVPKYSLHGYNSPHRPSFQLPACMLMWFFRTWYFITVCHLRSEWGKNILTF